MRRDAFLQWPDIPECVGCIYYRRLYECGDFSLTGMVCHYLLDTGHSRGCPPGERCNKKEESN